mgnify:CR=1 FL=1
MKKNYTKLAKEFLKERCMHPYHLASVCPNESDEARELVKKFARFLKKIIK